MILLFRSTVLVPGFQGLGVLDLSFFVPRLCLRGCLMHLIQVDRLYVDDCPRPSVNLSYVLRFCLSSVSSTFPQIV